MPVTNPLSLTLTPADAHQHDLLKRARRYLREASPETKLHLAAEVNRLLREAGAKVWIGANGLATVRVGNEILGQWTVPRGENIADQVWEDLIVGYLATDGKER